MNIFMVTAYSWDQNGMATSWLYLHFVAETKPINADRQNHYQFRSTFTIYGICIHKYMLRIQYHTYFEYQILPSLLTKASKCRKTTYINVSPESDIIQ